MIRTSERSEHTGHPESQQFRGGPYKGQNMRVNLNIDTKISRSIDRDLRLGFERSGGLYLQRGRGEREALTLVLSADNIKIMETQRRTHRAIGEGSGRLPGSGMPSFTKDPVIRTRLMSGVKRQIHSAKQVNERHHEIARMCVLGYRNDEIAKTLNITREFVSAVRNAPPVQEQIKLLSGARDKQTVDVARQIEVALPKCVDFLVKTIEDDDISDSLKSRNAFGLLATGGHGPAKNINVKAVHAVLSGDDIKEIRDAAANVAIEIDLIKEESSDG